MEPIKTHIWIHCPYVHGYIKQEGYLNEETLVFEYTQRTWMTMHNMRRTVIIQFRDYKEYFIATQLPTDTARVPIFLSKIMGVYRNLACYSDEIKIALLFILCVFMSVGTFLLIRHT